MASSNFDEFDRMFEQMDHALNDLRRRMRSGYDASSELVDETTGGVLGGRGFAGGRGLLGGSVHTRLSETEDGYRLVADLPGFEPEDIDLTAADGVLALSAVHEVPGEDERHTRRANERVTLPADADGEAASASYRNGVLEVEVPYAPEAETGKRIDIE